MCELHPYAERVVNSTRRPRLGVLIALAGVGIGLAAVAVTATVEGTAQSAGSNTNATANVENFAFISMDVVYELSRTDDGRSQVQITETIVALFPNFDQNRGIIRELNTDYDGVPLETSIHSVVDENGAPVHYEVDRYSGFLELPLGTDDFVQGRQTYVISYSQQNVVRNFTSTTGVDEFYWDVNGTGWSQPFGSVTATVIVDPEVATELTGSFACYQGDEGGTDPCDSIELIEVAADGTTTFRAVASALAPRQTLTFAIAFTDGTFVQVEAVDPRATPLWQHIMGILFSTLAGLLTILSIVLRAMSGRDHPGRGIIVPQYSVPKDLNIMMAAQLAGRMKAALPAQLVSLAVRRNLRILGYPVKSSAGKYALQFLSPDGLDDLEKRIITAIFGSPNPQPGAVRDIARADYTLGSALNPVVGSVPPQVIKSGFRLKPKGQSLGCLIPFAIMVMWILTFIFIDTPGVDASWWLGLSGFLLFFAFAVTALVSQRPARLTAAGADHRDYLIGMKQYLELAEKERFRVLQSSGGAERVNIRDDMQVIKLYERLLPFAVLWGVEESWLQELAVKMGPDANPDWYAGPGGFSPTTFATSISSISSSATASRSSSSGGSSSGGSSGGGSSGGGGGGGGGGGR